MLIVWITIRETMKTQTILFFCTSIIIICKKRYSNEAVFLLFGDIFYLCFLSVYTYCNEFLAALKERY